VRATIAGKPVTRERKRNEPPWRPHRSNGRFKLPSLAASAARPNGHADAATDIVICIHDALDDVRLCLDAIVAAGDDFPLRLVLVDDGSGQECAAHLRDFAARHPAIEIIRHDEPRGYTRAANAGLQRTTAPQIVLLNSDTIVTPGWLAGLRECLHSSPEIGIVGPLSNAASYQSIPVIRSPSGDWSLNPLPASWSVDQIAALVRQVSPRRFPRLPVLNGFCLMIARQIIDTIGLFDEDAFPLGFGEENDYCLRARDAGFALAVADHAYVFHAKSRSFGNTRRAALSATARQTLERKHGAERVRRDIAAIEANAELQRVRDMVREAFRQTSPPPAPAAPDALSVLFLLPVSGGGGGAHSVVQEALGMHPLGVRSHVAIKAAQSHLHAAAYPSAWGRGLFLPYDTREHHRPHRRQLRRGRRHHLHLDAPPPGRGQGPPQRPPGLLRPEEVVNWGPRHRVERAGAYHIGSTDRGLGPSSDDLQGGVICYAGQLRSLALNTWTRWLPRSAT
jgi:GT2 family glycosyltransferase